MTEVAALSQGRFVVPELVGTHFHLREGDVVADFGAGSGYFMKTLSKLVGSEGRVHACEIQKNLIETIADVARREHLGNIEILWGDLEELNGSKVPTDSLDAGILVNTLFQLEDKDTAFEEIKRALRNGGKLFVIDWSESFGGLGPQPDQVITESDAKAVAEQHGFTFERSFDTGDHHYGLAFRL
ncbi:MAG: ubiquinone/menaquinone biosynthesis C-methylase UbiE [Candidatus Azotimanducaceae bacterium]|jgi:ubiquinone/menaquinone biosynthesis C-methylase UbiE